MAPRYCFDGGFGATASFGAGALAVRATLAPETSTLRAATPTAARPAGRREACGLSGRLEGGEGRVAGLLALADGFAFALEAVDFVGFAFNAGRCAADFAPLGFRVA